MRYAFYVVTTFCETPADKSRLVDALYEIFRSTRVSSLEWYSADGYPILLQEINSWYRYYRYVGTIVVMVDDPAILDEVRKAIEKHFDIVNEAELDELEESEEEPEIRLVAI